VFFFLSKVSLKAAAMSQSSTPHNRVVVLKSVDGVEIAFGDSETALLQRSAMLSNLLECAEDLKADGTVPTPLEVPIDASTLALVHEFLTNLRGDDGFDLSDDTEDVRGGPDSHRDNNWQWRRHARVHPQWRRVFFRRHFCTNGAHLPAVTWKIKGVADAAALEKVKKARELAESDRTWALATIARKAAAASAAAASAAAASAAAASENELAAAPPQWMLDMAAQEPMLSSDTPPAVPENDDATRRLLKNFLTACDFLDIRRGSRAAYEWMGRDVLLPSTPEQIRAFFGIDGDGFTDEQRAKVLEENALVVDDDDDN